MRSQSVIEHVPNMFYVEFREDYLLMCLNCTYKKIAKDGKKSKASPYCKALILAILERWTNDKQAKGASLLIYMSYPQWIAGMYGMFGRNVMIDSIEELIGERLLTREPCKMYGRDTFQYLLNVSEINTRMKMLSPIRNSDEAQPLDEALNNQSDQATNQLDQVTNKRDTNLLVNATPFTSKRNIESTEIQNTDSSNKTQRRENGISPSSSLSVSSSQKERIVFEPEGKKVFLAWCSLTTSGVAASESNIKAANILAPLLAPWVKKLHLSLTEILQQIQKWAEEHDTTDYYQHKVRLYNIPNEFEGWQAEQEEEQWWEEEEEQVVEGMTREEAEALIVKIREDCPGIHLARGQLPHDRWTVGLWLGEGEQYRHIYRPEHWSVTDVGIKSALEAYQRYTTQGVI